MFKKSSAVTTILILAVLASCSNTQSSLSPFIIDETLRNEIHLSQGEIIWADEIDGYILWEEKEEEEKEESTFKTGNPEFDEMIKQAELMRAEAEKMIQDNGENDSQDLPKSNKKTDNLYLYAESTIAAVYPGIIGFGSLDIRAVDDTIKKILDSFLNSLQKGRVDSTYFSPGRSYLSAVLEYQLLQYPSPVRWMYGKPHIMENESVSSIEVPVRIWSENSHYDMWIYISSNGTAEYIDQVQLGSIIVE